MLNNSNNKKDSINKPTQLKWDPFSLRNPKYIQNTRKEVLKSIGIFSPWEKLKNYPKYLNDKISAKQEEKRKRKKLQKDKVRREALIKQKEKKVGKGVVNGPAQKKKPASLTGRGKRRAEEVKLKKEETEKKKRQELEFLKAKEKELKKVKWTSPDILKTNLVKDNVIAFINWKKNISLLLVGVFISIAIVGAVYQSVISKKREIEDAEQMLLEKITQINQKIALAEKNIEEVALLQNKLGLIERLIDGHIYWTNFFKFLEDITIEDVYYNGFSGSTGGAYTLAASAESFNMIAKQIEELRANEKVNVVKTNGGSVGGSEVGGSRVSFSLQLEIDTEVFHR